MKRRVHSSRKKVSSHTRAQKRIPKQLHFHMLFVYSTMCIFGLTILVALAYPTLMKISAKNTAYYSSNNHVLGISQKAAIPQKDTSFFQKLLNLVTPK